MRGRAVIAFIPLFASCLPHPTAAPWSGATPETWPGLRESLQAEREERDAHPWKAGLRVTMRDPVSGRVVDGRGAIAVAPGRAVRMILVGGAGATVLDAWVTATRWRIAVPPLDLVRRGGLDEPREMPVAFLRWWFVTPLRGTLFAATYAQRDVVWLLRDGPAVIELRRSYCSRGSLLVATRRAPGVVERVDECRELAELTAGDSARYVDEVHGLRIDVILESVSSGEPESGAFIDPDAPGGGT